MSLLKAVNFVSECANGPLDMSAYLRIGGNYITSFDGTLSAGHPIEEDLVLCPHADKLKAALKHVGANFSVTEMDGGRLTIKGKKLRSTVPCLADASSLPNVAPDPNIAKIGDELPIAFKRLVPLVKEDAQRLIEYSFLINNGMMCATNGQVVFQFWHGLHLPPNLIVPRKFGLIASKMTGLAGFGFSDKSLTFWYESGAWLRTNLCVGEWPDVDALLNVPSDAKPLPEDFWEGVKSVADFSNDNAVLLTDGKIKSSYTNETSAGGAVTGATFDCEGLIAKAKFDIKLLKLLEGVAETIDFNTHDDRAPFFGQSIRGMLIKRR